MWREYNEPEEYGIDKLLLNIDIDKNEFSKH